MMMMMMLRCCCLLKKMLLLFLLIAIASLVPTFLHQASSIATTFPLVYEQQHTSSIAYRNSHDQSTLSDDTRSKPAHQFQGHPKTLAMLQAPLARRKLLQHHHNKALLQKTTTMKKESAGNQQGGENKGYQRHGGRLELQRREEHCHELLLRIQSSSNDHHQAAAAADDLQRLHCAVIRSSLRVQALRKRAVLRSQPAAAALGSKVVAAAGSCVELLLMSFCSWVSSSSSQGSKLSQRIFATSTTTIADSKLQNSLSAADVVVGLLVRQMAEVGKLTWR
jgi:hypothetical protein